MHYSSIVYSLCSSTFEATNYEKSNDKRLSAPAPFLICSTTCVWSLKSGGYGGEGRKLMSIYSQLQSFNPLFSEISEAWNFQLLIFKARRLWETVESRFRFKTFFSGRRVYKSKLCQEKWQISPQFQAVETHLKKHKDKGGGFGGFVKHLVKHKIIILILLIICSSWAMFCCNQKSDCQKSIFPGCSCAEHWDASEDLEAGYLCLQREEVLPAHHHHSEQVDFEEERKNDMTLFS